STVSISSPPTLKDILAQKRGHTMTLSSNQLRKAGLFEELTEEDLLALRVLSTIKDYRPGETIIHEGDRGDAIFFLLSGQATVHKDLPDGRVAILATLDPGEYFGEMAVL